MRISRTTNCPYSYAISVRDVGTLGNESVFTKPLKKSNSIELQKISIVLTRYSASPTIYGTVDPFEFFRSFLFHLNVSVPQYRIGAHLKLKFHQEGI